MRAAPNDPDSEGRMSTTETIAADRLARKGTIWVCAACGKTHTDRYGIEGEGSREWDESCALHAVLCHAEKAPDENGNLAWWSAEEPG
jgi:hypothetical protein